MALIIKDRVKETTTTTGTGAVSLGGTSATFDTFQSVMSNGDTTFYAIVHTASATDEWEVGLGTWNTNNTLTRTTVYAGSNGTSAVNFSSGSKDIFMTYPASKAVVSGENASFANVTVTGTVDGRDVATDGSKLDGIESGATADQTAAEIKTAYESNSNTNAFTDTEKTKLSGIEAGATADQTASEILTAIKTVDGSGSNLDADLLDGQQGSYYLNTGTAFSGDVSGTYNNIVVANDSHTHDGRYYTETEADSRFATAAQGTTADAALPKAGGTMTGAITFASGQTFDGRDVSADGTKLDGIESGATADQTAAEIRTLVESATNSNVFTDADHTKLNGIETGATADQTASEILTAIKTVDGSGSGLDADTLDGNHASAFLTGNQTITLSGDVSGSGTTSISVTVADDSHNHVISNVDGLQTALNNKLDDTQKGAANGLAELDGSGKVPSSQLPSYVDDVLEYSSSASFPATGETGKLYVDLTTNDVHRWTGSTYVKVSDAVSSADQATRLATARTIQLTGDVTGSASFDGSANATITAVVQDDSHSHVISNVDGLQSALNAKAPTASPTFTGTITFPSGQTFDGRDVSADGTKLDGIEAGADVTDTANVTAAGALMDSEVTNLAQVKAFDSSNYATAAQGTKADAALPKAGGTMTGALNLGDNVKAQFGASNDLQIYHDGLHSYIDEVGTGSIYLRTDGNAVIMTNPTGTKVSGRFFPDNLADLYYNGSQKFKTENTGVRVYGNIVVSGTVDGRDVAADGTKLDGIESNATADQTASEIRTLVESATDSNVFTDADHTKLNGIEANADVTDTANVTAAGALMDSEVINLAQVKAFDSSDYATSAQGILADGAMPKTGGTFTGDVSVTGSINVTDVATTQINLDVDPAGTAVALAIALG